MFRHKIQALRRDQEFNPVIGCTILTLPFYLQEKLCINPPLDWSSNIVTGKNCEIKAGSEGLRLFEEAQRSFRLANPELSVVEEPLEQRLGKELMIRPRLGQGGVRVMVLYEYSCCCAITGEKTLPVLEAAHIKPYSENGPHRISNGREYYALHGKQLVSMPEDPGNRPASNFLEWHRNHCYRG